MNSGPTLSNLLSATFDQIGENTRLIAIYLAVMVPLETISLAIQGPGSGSDLGLNFGFLLSASVLAQGALAIAAVVGVFVVGLILYYWLYAGMAVRSLSPSFGRFLPFFGIYILSTLGITFGLVLLLIPGLILIVRWLLVLPMVLTSDKPAMDTFGESWSATSGHSWSIFGAIVILFFILIIAAGIIGGASYLLGGDGSVGAMAIEAFVDRGSGVLFIAFALGAYGLMHDKREDLTEMFE